MNTKIILVNKTSELNKFNNIRLSHSKISK